MSNKILFIGGSADGRHIEVPDSERYYLVPVPGGGTDEYRPVSLRAARDNHRAIFVWSKLSVSEAFDRLINFYVVPDKPAPKRESIEDKMLRLLPVIEPSHPEALLEYFFGEEAGPARLKLWDLLADKRIVLTWDRKIKLASTY